MKYENINWKDYLGLLFSVLVAGTLAMIAKNLGILP